MEAQNSTTGSTTLYPTMLTVVSLALWLAVAASLFVGHAWRDQLSVLALLPLVIVTGMFPNTLPLPSGLKLSRERMNFTLSDALVLLIACRFGFEACVFVAGIEGLTTSRPENAEFTQAERAALSAAAHRLKEAVGRDEVISSFVESLKSLVPYDSCAVTLVPPHTSHCVVAQAEGRHADHLNGRQIVTGEGVTGWVLANRRPFYNAAPALDLPPALVARDASYRTLAACPIIHGKELHGAVTLYSMTFPKYEAAHQQLVEALVALLAAEMSIVAQPRSPSLLPAILLPASRPAGGAIQGAPVFSMPSPRLTGVAVESELSH